MRAFEYALPGSLDEARKLAADGSVWKASGLDLLDLMKERIAAPKRVVSLLGLKELAGIEERDGSLRIGAGVTLTQLADHERVRARFPGLAHAAAEAATPHHAISWWQPQRGQRPSGTCNRRLASDAHR